jgi:hypothetical protein
MTVAAVAALLVLPACARRVDPAAAPPASAATPAAPSTSSRPATTVAPPAPVVPTPSSAALPVVRPPAATKQLPLGGRTILGRYRVVAYYGGPNGPALGALGDAPPEQMAAVIADRARQYARYGRRVQPAMELITTVAQAAPGPDGLYSKAIPLATVRHFLAVARAHRMLLILDFQPGRGEFLPQVEQFSGVLADPNVSVALDPEWKMAPGEVPATVIGSSQASSINAVGSYLSRLVARHDLPDKLLMVHQFTLGMLPDRDRIVRYPGVELVLHADGFGTPAEKLATWQRLAFPGRPDGAGFKLFLTQDSGLMSPAEVMRLLPRPDVITYQ